MRKLSAVLGTLYSVNPVYNVRFFETTFASLSSTRVYNLKWVKFKVQMSIVGLFDWFIIENYCMSFLIIFTNMVIPYSFTWWFTTWKNLNATIDLQVHLRVELWQRNRKTLYYLSYIWANLHVSTRNTMWRIHSNKMVALTHNLCMIFIFDLSHCWPNKPWFRM